MRDNRALETLLRVVLRLAVFGGICAASLVLWGVIAAVWLFLRHTVLA